MIEPRMDKGEPERLALRVIALREAILDVLNTSAATHDYASVVHAILNNAIAVDDDRAQYSARISIAEEFMKDMADD